MRRQGGRQAKNSLDDCARPWQVAGRPLRVHSLVRFSHPQPAQRAAVVVWAVRVSASHATRARGNCTRARVHLCSPPWLTNTARVVEAAAARQGEHSGCHRPGLPQGHGDACKKLG